MQAYIFRRLLLFIPTVWLVTLVVFIFMRLIPGDPALLILAGSEGEGNFTEQQLRDLRHELGTDRPLQVQYFDWMWDTVRGDFGKSFLFGLPVGGSIKKRIPLTIELTIMAVVISFVVAVPLGIISALNQDTPIDYIARLISFLGVSLPTFVVGMTIVYLLVKFFNWIPPLAYVPPWEDPLTNMSQLIFPALSQGFFMMAFVARVTRSSMLEVLREDYIRTARSKGLREMRVVYIHALQNAFLPILTVTGWAFGVLVGGSVITEQIFALPGMGRLLVDGVLQRDYPVIQALVLIVALMVLFLNLVIDILYAWVDPRIRFA